MGDDVSPNPFGSPMHAAPAGGAASHGDTHAMEGRAKASFYIGDEDDLGGLSTMGGGQDLDGTPAPDAAAEPRPPEGLAEYTDWAIERSGGWGRFQKRYTLFLNIPWILCGAQTMAQVFTTLPPHRRRVCTQQADACNYAAVAEDDCSLLRAEYEYLEPAHTVASEFDLICSSSMLAPLLGTLFFLGFFGGAFVISGLADSRGRRRAFLWGMIVVQLGAFLACVAPSYGVYAFARFLVGFGVGGVGLVAYVWNAEVLGSEARAMLVLISNCLFAFGCVVLSPLSAVVTKWRALTIVLFVLGLPVLFMQIVLLESPKWLASKQKTDELYAVLKRIAEVNGCPAPPRPLARGFHGSESGGKQDVSGSTSGADVLRLLLFDRRLSDRFFPMCLAWFSLSLGYYGLSMNVSNLGMNVYISSAISSLVEMPGYALAFFGIDSPRLGRRGTTCAGLCFGGVCCFVGGVLLGGSSSEERPSPICLVFLFMGKLAVAVSFAVVYMFAAELFPTSVRSRSIGLQSLSARVGGMLAPMVANLGKTSRALPMFVFGLPCLISGIALLRLPETLGKPMLDSVEEIPAPMGGSSRLPCFKRYRQLEDELEGNDGGGESGHRPAPHTVGAASNAA